MAINSVGFIAPRAEPVRQEKPKKTAMEQILEGLQIANGVLSIGTNVQSIRDSQGRIEARNQEMKILDKKVSDDAADAMRRRAAEDDYAAGRLTKGQQIDLAQKGFTPAKEGMPGAFSVLDKDSGQSVLLAKTQQPQQTPLQRSVDPIAERRMALEEKKFKYQQDRDAKAAAAPQAKPEGQAPAVKLNAEERKRLDSASMGLAAAKDMGDALAGGSNTFSVVGDNDFTAARTRFEEALGRMQSGGAINNEEAARFRTMAPTFKDSEEMQQKKMAEVYREMALRVKSLGADPDEVLANRKSVAVPEFTPKGSGTAQAAPFPGRLDPQVEGYAKQHGLDYQTAKAILAGRGYKPNE